MRNNPLGEDEGCHPGQKTRQYALREEAGQSRESCSLGYNFSCSDEARLPKCASLHLPFVWLTIKCLHNFDCVPGTRYI